MDGLLLDRCMCCGGADAAELTLSDLVPQTKYKDIPKGKYQTDNTDG